MRIVPSAKGAKMSAELAFRVLSFAHFEATLFFVVKFEMCKEVRTSACGVIGKTLPTKCEKMEKSTS